MSILPPVQPKTILRRGTWREAQAVAQTLRTETTGGMLMLAGALLALVWANSPWAHGYSGLRELRLGPSALHLDLSLAQWAADGLLAIFFFVAGLELKREFVVGDLRDPSKAALPVAAAACGVAVPALIYTGVVLVGGAPELVRGWAIPTATDIAFALAVLAVISTHLPSALRSFLLTLAVVDDLIAIVIIAIFYTSSLSLPLLAAALVPLGLFALAVQKRRSYAWLLWPLAFATWALVHASGIHATVAGVALAFTVPATVSPRYQERFTRAARGLDLDEGQQQRVEDYARHSAAERFEHRLRPLSAGVAVPLFALMSAGVSIAGDQVAAAVRDPAALGVAAGLVIGKLLGVFGGTWAFARFTRAQLDSDLAWSDIFGMSLLAGVGFTVSLLVGELAFGDGTPTDEHVKLAILFGSLAASVLAAIVLRSRNRAYRLLDEREQADDDKDGVPDVYQQG